MTEQQLDILRMRGAVRQLGDAIKEQLNFARIAATNAFDGGNIERFEHDKKIALEAWAEAKMLYDQYRTDSAELTKMVNSVIKK